MEVNLSSPPCAYCVIGVIILDSPSQPLWVLMLALLLRSTHPHIHVIRIII